MNYLATAVGLLAVVMYVISYQQKKRRNIVLFGAISRGLYVAQYFLLLAFEGAVLDILGTVASVFAGRKNKPFMKKHLKAVIVVLNVAMLVAGAFLYEDIVSLFPVIGVMLQTGAFWLDDEKQIRRMSLAGSPFWLAYNLINCAYGSVVGDVLCIVSLTVAMIRYDFLKRGKDRADETGKDLPKP